jgi:hypothetical protein
MNHSWNKVEILVKSEETFNELTSYCSSIPETIFFRQPADKWSIAQNIHHLIIITKTSTAAFALPIFLVRLIGGKATRASWPYEKLVYNYKVILDEGGKAKGRYIPPPLKPSRLVSRERIMANWRKSTGLYLQTIRKSRTDSQLDKYMVPHPLLGKITLRELCYFNIYHTLHHLEIIRYLCAGK